MGACSSAPDAESQALDAELQALKHPYWIDEKPGHQRWFYCLADDEELKQQSREVVLEVGELGMRLLRPDEEECLHSFFWGTIHSWGEIPDEFAFNLKVYEEATQSFKMYRLRLRDLDKLMDYIKVTINTLMAEREGLAMSPETFAELLQMVKSAAASSDVTPVSLLSTGPGAGHLMTSKQGAQLVKELRTLKDKVGMAVALHARMVNRMKFTDVLESLPDEADRAAVWNLITAIAEDDVRRRHGRGEQQEHA